MLSNKIADQCLADAGNFFATQKTLYRFAKIISN
jgi:hypothetical protein